MRAAVAGNRFFSALLLAGIVLRVFVVLGFPPALWFNDSFDFLRIADGPFPHPLRPGDTLYSETTVLDKRLSNSRPGQGIVTLEHVGRNQDGVVVGRAVRTTLVHTAPASAPTS